MCPNEREMLTNFPQWRTLSKAGTKKDYNAKLAWSIRRHSGTVGFGNILVIRNGTEQELGPALYLAGHGNNSLLISDPVLYYYYRWNRSRNIGFPEHWTLFNQHCRLCLIKRYTGPVQLFEVTSAPAKSFEVAVLLIFALSWSNNVRQLS